MTSEAVGKDHFDILPVTSLEHLQQCVDLQIAVWGYSDGDVIPRRIFVVANRIGGQVIGAFDQGALVGFLMSLPGYRDGTSYLHSHMLAVHPEYRNAGLGRTLKLAQREDALGRGYRLIEWTFDPLEIKNAYLNLARLGAICRRYEADFYGPSTSPLQGGLPTDRLVAEWWLQSEHVSAILQARRGDALPHRDTLIQARGEERILVPAAVSQWKQNEAERDHALRLQQANRLAFQTAFRSGLAAIGFRRDEHGNGSYLLGPWNQAPDRV